MLRRSCWCCRGVHVRRQEAWDMFDFGYSSYMKYAFPKVRQPCLL
jgi:hypothetical protein